MLQWLTTGVWMLPWGTITLLLPVVANLEAKADANFQMLCSGLNFALALTGSGNPAIAGGITMLQLLKPGNLRL